jgi:hypothetical protein
MSLESWVVGQEDPSRGGYPQPIPIRSRTFAPRTLRSLSGVWRADTGDNTLPVSSGSGNRADNSMLSPNPRLTTHDPKNAGGPKFFALWIPIEMIRQLPALRIVLTGRLQSGGRDP